MKTKRLALDIELTNRCNALCNFCPRDKTPEQGFIADDIFIKAVERAAEESVPVMMAGQGESLIHPRFDMLIPHFSRLGVPFALTTNAALLTPEKSRFLLDQGIFRITFSVSDLGDDYEEVYNLDFNATRSHIQSFMEMNDGRSEVWISVVEHDINRDKIDSMRQYWEALGVTGVHVFRQITRGGACQTGHYFLRSDKYRQEAETLMASKGVSTLCNLAFVAPFVGWNGQYYICCSDYEKVEPLGSVFDYSLEAVDDVKLQSIYKGNTACLKCNYDPVNVVREAMFEVEHGEAQPARVANRLAILRQQQDDYPGLYESIDWRADWENRQDAVHVIARQK